MKEKRIFRVHSFSSSIREENDERTDGSWLLDNMDKVLNAKYRIVETYEGFIVQERKNFLGLFWWWGTNDYWKHRLYTSFNNAKTSIIKNCIEFKSLKPLKPLSPKYQINEVVTFHNTDIDGKWTNEVITGRIVRITVNSNNGHVSYEYGMADSEKGHVYVGIPEKYIIS